MTNPTIEQPIQPPDDLKDLQIKAFTAINQNLRNEIEQIKGELQRQDQGYLSLIASLEGRALDTDCSAVRAAVLKEIAKEIRDVLEGTVNEEVAADPIPGGGAMD